MEEERHGGDHARTVPAQEAPSRDGDELVVIECGSLRRSTRIQLAGSITFPSLLHTSLANANSNASANAPADHSKGGKSGSASASAIDTNALAMRVLVSYTSLSAHAEQRLVRLVRPPYVFTRSMSLIQEGIVDGIAAAAAVGMEAERETTICQQEQPKTYLHPRQKPN